jgi:hypothetical protein
MKRFLVILSIIFLQQFLVAQVTSQDLMGIIYNKETVFDFRLHNNGPLSLGINFGKIKTYYKTTFLRFDVDELKHWKEVKQTVDAGVFSGQTNSYTFGKQNNFIVLRSGYGFKKYHTEKAAQNGVAIATILEGGVSLGLLKPYYLRVVAEKDFAERSIKYSEETKDEFLNLNKIIQSESYFKGFSEIKPVLGVHMQAGLHFDWGAFDEMVKALEVGIMLDIFPKNIPILVNEQNRPYFMNFYVSLQLGKRR